MPLGIIPKSENKTEEMVSIMDHLHQYVPMVEKTDFRYVPSINTTVEVTTAKVKPILFGGDQLTVARAKGAQKAKVNSVSPSNRFDGLVPMIEDWHTKVILLKVS